MFNFCKNLYIYILNDRDYPNLNGKILLPSEVDGAFLSYAMSLYDSQ